MVNKVLVNKVLVDNLLSQTHAQPQPQARGRLTDTGRKAPSQRSEQRRKNWASAVDLACLDPEMLHWGGLEEARRGSSALSTRSAGRHRSASRPKEGRHSDFSGLQHPRAHHLPALSVSSALSSAYDRIRERQRKLHALQQAMDGEYCCCRCLMCRRGWVPSHVLLITSGWLFF